MREEIMVVIDLIKDKYNINENKEVKVIYSENNVMHTIQIDGGIYKAINLKDEWKITLQK